MSTAPPATRFADSIDRHPPERRRRTNESIVVYMCSCSCCCCCLHTVGGTVGVFVAGGFEGKDGRPSPQGMFWRSFVVTVVLAAIGSIALGQRSVVQSLFMLGGALVIAGPLFLLAASFLMSIWLLCRSGAHAEGNYYAGAEGSYWRTLGRITVYMITGSIVGLAAMYLAYLAMRRR